MSQTCQGEKTKGKFSNFHRQLFLGLFHEHFYTSTFMYNSCHLNRFLSCVYSNNGSRTCPTLAFVAGYTFLEDMDCNINSDLGDMQDLTCHHDACKVWCDCRSDCAGFRYNKGNMHCYFKALSCLNSMTPNTNGHLYLKP